METRGEREYHYFVDIILYNKVLQIYKNETVFHLKKREVNSLQESRI